MITRYVSCERVGCGYVQPIIGRPVYTAPMRAEAGGSYVGCALGVRSRRRARQRLYIFDAGIGACSASIVGPHPVIVARMRSQPGHAVAGYVSNIQIMITRYVSGERVGCGDVQPITGRAAYASPVGGEAVKGRSEERRVGKEGRSRWSPNH